MFIKFSDPSPRLLHRIFVRIIIPTLMIVVFFFFAYRKWAVGKPQPIWKMIGATEINNISLVDIFVFVRNWGSPPQRYFSPFIAQTFPLFNRFRMLLVRVPLVPPCGRRASRETSRLRVLYCQLFPGSAAVSRRSHAIVHFRSSASHKNLYIGKVRKLRSPSPRLLLSDRSSELRKSSKRAGPDVVNCHWLWLASFVAFRSSPISFLPISK